MAKKERWMKPNIHRSFFILRRIGRKLQKQLQLKL